MMDGMDDPFYERWSQVEVNVREASTYKDYQSYRLKPMIVKSNDDLR
jgi:phosphatidylinositol kinase/protein kinase (PI-3  family)